MLTLNELKNKIRRSGPLITVILDGVGIAPEGSGNAVTLAETPILDGLFKTCMHTQLRAHGKAVGLPSDGDMGNSEVGHNAIGAGRVFNQGAKLVNQAIESGSIWEGKAWIKLIEQVKENGSTLHFIGLFSDGNVHSHINHLQAMLQRAKEENVLRVRIHILLDGRDVGETSALDYLRPFEGFLDGLNSDGVDYKIASGGGRMNVTMDRYEADWRIVECGWKTHVLGQGEMYASAEEAITAIRKNNPEIIDQFFPPFVIAEKSRPVGPVLDGDSVIFFNFRGDRSIEISRAFEDVKFDKFDRQRRPDIAYAGMMEYDGDLHIPSSYLVSPPAIDRTLGEYLSKAGITQLACSETQKFGHVTYFWNGNRSGKFDDELETYIEITSDIIPFEQRPWMKCAEITDTIVNEIETGRHQFIRINYANGDMVGHTGVVRATALAMEAVDLAMGRLLRAVEKAGGVALITADHGNADEMFEMGKDGKPKVDENGKFKSKTSHTLNPVPFIIYDPGFNGEYRLADLEKPGLSNIAATILNFLGFTPPEDFDKSLIEIVR
ncbi:2,3-bisphosphoglycerate-independent phosphoglycerate mutase [bacterium]|nr:2,3-bisphosphoglycerate-independent phosphoglycerate mutase [bacterium]